MTSHCSSYCRIANRVPHLGRISAIANNDKVDFIYQFVEHTKNENNFKRRGHYLTGTPTKFPNYGDFPQTFSMRNYGTDISISAWQNEDIDYIPQIDELKLINNHIDIEFHEAVYPIRVSIYEIYNPGNIIRIWAKNSDPQPYLLWEGSPQTVPPTSRLFSPPLQSCDFKTKSLRLEFKRSTWDYCTKLDAVMLIGTSELIVPKNPEESLTDMLKRINCSMYFQHETEDVHNLTTDYENVQLDIVHLQENFSEYCMSHKSDLVDTFPKYLNRENVSEEVMHDYVLHFKQRYDLHYFLPKFDLNSAKPSNLSLDGSMELSNCNFSKLPEEVILKVLKNLDLRALCRMSQVNKRFNTLIRDSQLYTFKCLNVRWLRFINPTYNIFDYFTARCKDLQQLDLTASEFSVSDFIKFLNNCGSRLTHLRLNKCSSVDNIVLLEISKICKNLKKLDLRRCRLKQSKIYFFYTNINTLGFPEHLSICPTSFECKETQTPCEIPQEDHELFTVHLDQIHELHLDQMRELHLEKLNITCIHQSLETLFSSCQHLEEVYLSRIFTNRYFYLLTLCKNLKKLYLRNITSDNCSVILEQCPKLQELHFINCETNKLLLNRWKESYPHVSVFVKTENYL